MRQYEAELKSYSPAAGTAFAFLHDQRSQGGFCESALLTQTAVLIVAVTAVVSRPYFKENRICWQAT